MNSNLQCLAATYATELLQRKLTQLIDLAFVIPPSPMPYSTFQINLLSMEYVLLVPLFHVQVCFTKSFTAWMNVGEKKEDDGRSGLQCFCFGWGHNWSGESWEALIWTQPLQSAMQYKSWRTVKYSVACISVEVVWVDLAGAWFYGKRRHGVTSQSHPKTHHILHFVSTVTRSRLFYIS